MTRLCNREEEAAAAAISRRIDPSLSDHLERCESCRAATRMTSLFRADESWAYEVPAPGCLPDIVWVRTLYVWRRQQLRKQRLGLVLGAAAGILAGYLTSVLIAPSHMALSFTHIGSLLTHGLTLLWPTVLVLLMSSFVILGGPADRLVPGNR